MKKKFLLIIMFSVLLVACTNVEQEAYEDHLMQAKNKINIEEFEEAQALLIEAVSIEYEENMEAQNLLKQLEQYHELESLLSEGKFEEVFRTVESVSVIEQGSTVIASKAKEFKKATVQQQNQYHELQTTVTEILKLIEDKKYEEANEQLKEIDLLGYKANYYAGLKEKITNMISANDEQIELIIEEEARKKAEAEKKAKEEEARKKAEAEKIAKAEEERKKTEAEKIAKEEKAHQNTMLNWSDQEIERYIANHFGMNRNHMSIIIYDRTSSGYQIEVRQNNAALGKGDPNVSPALGFFEVRQDGKLYKLDMLSGDYQPLN